MSFQSDLTQSVTKRKKLGEQVAYAGLFANFILVCLKLGVGIVSHSMTLLADAVNNLSDFFSAIVTLWGFHIAARPADKQHPFGHARFEYLSSALIAVFILWLGGQLAFQSLKHIYLGDHIATFNRFSLYVMGVSVVLKTVLCFIQKRAQKKINSLLLEAAIKDSISDIILSLALLGAIVLDMTMGWRIDNYVGLLVSLLIIHAGYSVLKRTFDILLGNKVPQALRKAIREYVLSFKGVLGVHDLIVHNYGPGQCFASIHVEIDAKSDLLSSHQLIDTIERSILHKHNVRLLIHIDPMIVDDPLTAELEAKTKAVCQKIHNKCFVHEFRRSSQGEYQCLIFDLAVPDDCKLSNTELREVIQTQLCEQGAKIKTFITIDRHYASDPVRVAEVLERENI